MSVKPKYTIGIVQHHTRSTTQYAVLCNGVIIAEFVDEHNANDYVHFLVDRAKLEPQGSEAVLPNTVGRNSSCDVSQFGQHLFVKSSTPGVDQCSYCGLKVPCSPNHL